MISQPPVAATPLARLALWWGVGGPILLLLQAIVRLTPLAIEPLGVMTAGQMALWVLSLGFNTYSEGYRGFSRSFSPRVVSRALHLARHPRPLAVALAPLYTMSLICAPWKVLARRWGFIAGLVALIVAVHALAQPWRGIIDAGVVAGLIWGAAATLWLAVRAVRGRVAVPARDLPEPA